MSTMIRNQAKLAGIAFAAGLAWTASADVAVAQSGSFNTGGANAPSCVDIGTQLRCEGKVSGLGGTTFTILVEGSGTASVVCTNPGQNPAPGQDTAVTVAGTVTGITPRNGSFNFTLTTEPPTVENVPTCPNRRWTATVTDVMFGEEVTLTLLEDGTQSDQITVPVTQ